MPLEFSLMLPEAKDGEKAPWSRHTHMLSSRKNRAQTCFHRLCIPVLPRFQAGQKGPRFRNRLMENNSSMKVLQTSWDLIPKAVLTFGYSADPAGRS